MTSTDHAGDRFLWTRSPDPPPGEVLAALRRGLDREPGSVPAMWRYYSTLQADGRLTPRLEAEHFALSLFGLHQQSRRTLVHRPGVGVGAAARGLHEGGRYSQNAVDQRFAAMATAATPAAAAHRLRGLVAQMRATPEIPGLDYTRLLHDLLGLSGGDEQAARTRRQWGAGYLIRARQQPPPGMPADTPADIATDRSAGVPSILEET